MFKKFIKQLKDGEYLHGSVFKFDWYIDLFFMETMAFYKNPIYIGFYQPIIGDEFLNPCNYKNKLNSFSNFFQNQKNINNLINRQDKIIKSADSLIKKVPRNSKELISTYGHYFYNFRFCN